jgi:hypothetical protein
LATQNRFGLTAVEVGDHFVPGAKLPLDAATQVPGHGVGDIYFVALSRGARHLFGEEGLRFEVDAE